MDSRLLNAFHDDPFDGNYVKYDTDSQFWSGGTEALGLQLTETLHGILPIAPTEVISTNLYNGSMLKDEDYSLESKHDANTNSIIYGGYENGESLAMVNNKRQLASQQGIEIVSVDPNIDFDSDYLDSSDEENEDDEEQRNNGLLGVSTFDEVRSCSRSTFRTRTDSSSIGDYESHSSDYYESDEEHATDGLISNMRADSNILELDKFDMGVHADDGLSKKGDEDVDAFGIQIDGNNFDLAAFITQDDHVYHTHSSAEKVQAVSFGEIIAPMNHSDSDSDSDVIVDVETVENDDAGEKLWSDAKEETIEDIAYADNVKSDPYWSPSKHHVEKKELVKPAVEPNFTSNFTLVPNKRQSDILKRKFGIGRGKNISMHRNPSKSTPKSEPKAKNLISQVRIPAPEKNIEALIKQEKPPIKEEPKPLLLPTAVQTQPLGNGKSIKLLKHDTESIKQEPKEDKPVKHEEVAKPVQAEAVPKKRKLNLEEYKKRRENPSANPPNPKEIRTVDTHKLPKTEAASIQTTPHVEVKLQPKMMVSKPQNTEVTSIVKSLKENQCSKRFVDPITEAKNKVLRLQELKKAQQIKIIDSTVSSKVGRVTKILPLKDIVKDTYKSMDDEECESHVISHPDYEEIVIVSIGCNTDVSIPPNGYSTTQPKSGKNMSRSLLKSNVLLANISNSFQKVRSDDTVKISSNSLIVSIQDVVVKNAPMPTEPIKPPQSSSSVSEHGEDKIIMHLRKDRIRKRKFTQSTQTELLPEFPALCLPSNGNSNKSCDNSVSGSRKEKRRKKYRSRQNSYSSDEDRRTYRDRSRSSSSRSVGKRSRRHRSSISSSYSESDDYPKRGGRYSGSSSRSRERSLSSSGRRSRSRSFERVYRNSRSRSSSRSTSRRGPEANRFVDRNVSAPAVEERRIVYVGRIEQDTTKEMLRRKFVAYGPIKQITIHYKDTGMKYGFVTYEKSEDAFRVIDCGPKDGTINMYDISFGGRRAFCRASYADLDNAGINTYQSYVVPRPVAPPKEEDSFEALLLKVKAKLNATKTTNANSKI